MLKTLTRSGTSLALVIPSKIRELLRIKEDTPIQITTDGDAIILKPVRDKKAERELKSHRAQLKKFLKELDEEDGEVLKRLAE